LLNKDQLEEAKMISLFLDPYMESKYYYEKTRKLFIDGLITILEGHVREGTGKAKKAIEIMSYMDEQFAEDHLAELDKYLK